MRRSQNLSLLPKCIYPPSTTICSTPSIYPSLPEYNPFSTTMLLCYAPRISPSLPEYTPPPPSTTICDTLKNYPSLREYTLFFDNYITPSPLPLRISHLSFLHLYTIFQEYTPQSLIMPTFLVTTTCICQRIDHSLPVLRNILGGRGRFWEGCIIL